MRLIDKETLDMILEKHKKWLQNQEGGERANLYNANLRNADLRCADLRRANLCNASMNGANLYCADLRKANMRNTDLRYANLGNADLCGADLRCANLYCTFLDGVNLRNADLRGAGNVPFIPMACPDSGSFTAWKKANGYVVKLLVPADARRSSSTGRKCRCDKAVVIAIETTDGKPSGLNEIASDYKSDFIYMVGETVTVPNFCKDRFRECAEGIHFLSTVERRLIIKINSEKET